MATRKKQTPPPARRMDTLTPKEIAQQQRFLARSLANPEVTDEMLQCMDPSLGHRWDIVNDLHVIPQATEGRATTHIGRDYKCGRCDKTKHEKYFITKRNGVERLERLSMTYGNIRLSLPGIPRGVKPAEIVRAEQYRRALERALKTSKGQRLRSSR